MPGAFAHFTIVDRLATKSNLTRLQLNQEAIKALLRWDKFYELGAVSPDYPYLDLGDSEAKRWADNMHYVNTVDVVRKGIEKLRELSGSTKQKCLAWLMGYAAHIGTDVTIHPVVERIAGSYNESTKNQQKHRTCEMHQDVFIWQFKRENLNRFSVCEYLDKSIGRCSNGSDASSIDNDIREFWESILREIYPQEFSANHPNINKWHSSFLTIVDIAEETQNPDNPLFTLSRHLLDGKAIMYPSEPDVQYTENLEVPPTWQRKSYNEIFEYALRNVGQIWKGISDAVFDTNMEYFDNKGNWDLDTGKYLDTDKKGLYVFWT